MIKFILYFISFLIAGLIYLFALGGSHGETLFRLDNNEDLAILFLLIIFLGLPVFFIVWDVIKRHNLKRDN